MLTLTTSTSGQQDWVDILTYCMVDSWTHLFSNHNLVVYIRVVKVWTAERGPSCHVVNLVGRRANDISQCTKDSTETRYFRDIQIGGHFYQGRATTTPKHITSWANKCSPIQNRLNKRFIPNWPHCYYSGSEDHGKCKVFRKVSQGCFEE